MASKVSVKIALVLGVVVALGAASLATLLLTVPALWDFLEADRLAALERELPAETGDAGTILGERARPGRERALALLAQTEQGGLHGSLTLSDGELKDLLGTIRAADFVANDPAAAAEEKKEARLIALETWFIAVELSGDTFGARFDQAMARAGESDDRDLAARALWLTIAHRHLGRDGDTAGALEAIEAFHDRFPDDPAGAELFLTLAKREYAQGWPTPARAAVERGIALYRDTADTGGLEGFAKTLAAEGRDARPTHDSARTPARVAKREVTEKGERKPVPKSHAKAAKSPRGKKTPEGKSISFVAPTLAGSDLNLARYKGKVVLIDFWATWCGPCRRELPRIKAVYDKYRQRGLEVVGVSLDTDPAALKEFLQEHQIRWPQVFYPNPAERGWNSPLAKRFGVTSIPSLILVDASGRVVGTGLRGEGVLEAAVAEQLATTTVRAR